MSEPHTRAQHATSLDETPERTAAEKAATRRALGWVRPDGMRFGCSCGFQSDSPAEAGEHARTMQGAHAMIDGRDGATVRTVGARTR